MKKCLVVLRYTDNDAKKKKGFVCIYIYIYTPLDLKKKKPKRRYMVGSL